MENPHQASKKNNTQSDEESVVADGGRLTTVDLPPEMRPSDVANHVLAKSGQRTCLEALELCGITHNWLLEQRVDLFQKPKSFWEQTLASDSERPWQTGDLVHIPKVSGKLFLFSDLEGHKPILEAALKKHNIIERMIINNPDDQVYLALLGDTVDREGNQATEILEAMYDLKVHWGLWQNIYILSGNHELGPENIQRSPTQGGFFQEVCQHRESYRRRDLDWDALTEPSKKMVNFMCQWIQEFYPETYGCDALLVALWRTYNQIFLNAPKSIITGNGLFIAHAGITDKGPFRVVREEESFRPPDLGECLQWLSLATNDSLTLDDLIWSDYSTESDFITTNKRGGVVDGRIQPGPGLAFGEEALGRFLSAIGDKTCMIRGHQVNAPEGCSRLGKAAWTNGSNLITFSSAHHGEYLEVPLSKDILTPDQVQVHQVKPSL